MYTPEDERIEPENDGLVTDVFLRNSRGVVSDSSRKNLSECNFDVTLIFKRLHPGFSGGRNLLFVVTSKPTNQETSKICRFTNLFLHWFDGSGFWR